MHFILIHKIIVLMNVFFEPFLLQIPDSDDVSNGEDLNMCSKQQGTHNDADSPVKRLISDSAPGGEVQSCCVCFLFFYLSLRMLVLISASYMTVILLASG